MPAMPYHPKVDEYIQKSQSFAQHILQHLRQIVHQTCVPVQEDIKWGMPAFIYADALMCGMSAFKQHCTFGFWKASLMGFPELVEQAKAETAMGHLGKITSIDSLPPTQVLVQYIQKAMELNEQGIKVKRSTQAKQPFVVPNWFMNQLKQHTTQWQAFDAMSSSHKKEYVMWIEEAKTEATQQKRFAQMLLWLQEGKSRHWKYAK